MSVHDLVEQIAASPNRQAPGEAAWAACGANRPPAP